MAATELSMVPQYSQDTEISTTGAAAEKQFEIQSAIIVAQRFPRNEDVAFSKLMLSCQRPSFAEKASYSFPRGNKFNEETGKWEKNYVTGPSVYLAREMARTWGNLRHGVTIVQDDAEMRTIEGFAWDLETNTKVSQGHIFAKLIQRKQSGETKWVAPDERDLRELTNKHGAIAKRNCILEIMPKDRIEDALEECKKTLQADAAKDPTAARKKIILAFSEFSVTVPMLEAKLGHALSQCQPKELAELRQIYTSIKEGHTTWAEHVKPADEKPLMQEPQLKPEFAETETAAPIELATEDQLKAIQGHFDRLKFTPIQQTDFLGSNYGVGVNELQRTPADLIATVVSALAKMPTPKK